jgi:hypothetical protein
VDTVRNPKREDTAAYFNADVVGALEVQLLLDGRQRSESREEVARRHYWIAAMSAREGLEVDWEFVALRMAQALLGLPEGDEA